jgi:hypothetical protein
LEWGVLGLTIFGAILTYIVVQGTRAAMAWRKAAAAGDVKVIGEIVEGALSAWRSAKRPKEVAPDVWRGIQSMQLVEVGPEFVRVSCQAEGDYKLVNGRWFEQASPLQEGMATTSRALEMLLYELPHFSANRVQVDVYTTFRETGAPTRRGCILSTVATREGARQVDWEEWTPAQIVEEFDGRYELDDQARPLPIEVEEPKTPEPENAEAPPSAPIKK